MTLRDSQLAQSKRPACWCVGYERFSPDAVFAEDREIRAFEPIRTFAKALYTYVRVYWNLRKSTRPNKGSRYTVWLRFVSPDDVDPAYDELPRYRSRYR